MAVHFSLFHFLNHCGCTTILSFQATAAASMFVVFFLCRIVICYEYCCLLTLGAHACCESYCSCPVCVCVCVCVCVRSFLPPRASRSRNIGTYMFTVTRKNFYNCDFSLKMLGSEAMASFACLGCHQLHLNPK